MKVLVGVKRVIDYTAQKVKLKIKQIKVKNNQVDHQKT